MNDDYDDEYEFQWLMDNDRDILEADICDVQTEDGNIETGVSIIVAALEDCYGTEIVFTLSDLERMIKVLKGEDQ